MFLSTAPLAQGALGEPHHIPLRSASTPRDPQAARGPHPALTWLEATDGPPRAVVVVAHGLNLRPERMDGLGDLLRAHGASVLRVALAGHRGSLAEFKQVTHRLWRSEITLALEVAAARSRSLDRPLYLAAFSLGALLALEAAAAAGSGPPFERAVLLAPAVALRPRALLVEPLGVLGPGFTLPSASPVAYRCHDGTPMAGYRALFEARRALRRHGLAHLDIPTLVFVDPEDELVDAAGIGSLISREQLSRWSVVEVSVSGSRLPTPRHHLIVDEDAVGPAQWQTICDLSLRHLGLSEGPL